MEFRPCIDIHNGKVKQIVGGSLRDEGDYAAENYVSDRDSSYYADLFRAEGLQGGHIILLNPAESPYYAATKEQALLALRTFPGGMQIGGGITPENAGEFLDAGASHVIVTSYVFRDGRILEDRLEALVRAVGREHLVLDLSCRKTADGYRVVTDRWQKMTDQILDTDLLQRLQKSCDEFLIHAVDVEGKAEGPEIELVERLASYEGNSLTYAGGIRSYEDIRLLRDAGQSRIHVTVGSALDLYGGPLSWKEVSRICREQK